jgi:hypothetical protein
MGEGFTSTQEGAERSSVPNREALNVLPQGTERPSIEVLNDVQSSTSMSTSMSTSLDDGTQGIDVTQDLLPWMKRQWEKLQASQSKSIRRKFNPGPHAEQFERQEEAIGKLEYRRNFIQYLHSDDNRGMVNFAKAMAPLVSGGRRSSGNGFKPKIDPYAGKTPDEIEEMKELEKWA